MFFHPFSVKNPLSNAFSAVKISNPPYSTLKTPHSASHSDVQDYPRILQFSPPRRPCARYAIAAPTGRARARRVPGLPPAQVLPGGGSWAAGLCRNAVSLGAQAAQLLCMPALIADSHTGAPRARPPAPDRRAGALSPRVLRCFQRRKRAHPGRISSSADGRAHAPRPALPVQQAFALLSRRCFAARGMPPPSPLPCTLPPNPRRAASRPPRGMRKRLKQGRGAGLAVPVRHWRHG